MKRLVFAFLVACLHLAPAHAQVNTCPVLPQQVVVYFGNGINTNQESARRSRDLLRDNLGTTYNNRTLRYDTAYNATDDMALDLVQAARQAGVQWDSDLANWLGRLEIAPAWFVSWYQRQIEQRSLAYAPEMDQHVDSFRNAISLGQRVLVVSHSQGNFYANEAKRFLRQRLTTEQMARFAIYGVAVPTNNIGGASGPYLTNHRDFISLIPDALAANFTLRRGAGGLPADDVGRIQAHLFNDTYLSDDFNIRPALLQGVRAELDRFETVPPADCVDDVRAYLVGLGSGQYRCFGDNEEGREVVVGNASIGRNGVIQVTGQNFFGMPASSTIDVTHPNVALSFPLLDSGLAFYGTQQETVRAMELVFSAGWDETGLFDGTWVGSREDTSSIASCRKPLDSPNTQTPDRPLPSKGEQVAEAMRILTGPRRLRFEAGQCVSSVNPRISERPVDIEFTASGVRMNDIEAPWSELLGSNTGILLASQRELLPNNTFAAADDYLPKLALGLNPDGKLFFMADARRGLRSFIFSDPVSGMTCGVR